eukprot:609886-Rhodomonas_salina.2
MSGTDLQPSPPPACGLRSCVCSPLSRPSSALLWYVQLSLRVRYEMSGTDVTYAAATVRY